MPVSEMTFESVVLEDVDGQWELHRGKLREKPPMSFGHNFSAQELAYQLIDQLDRREYHVFQSRGHLRAPNGDTYIPDVAVIPVGLMSQFRGSPARSEVYDQPLPFLSEIWSPKTGTFDIDTKLPAYRLRGDAEIWRLHPDGTYEESSHEGGTVQLHASPWVVIDLDALFVSN